MRKVALVVNTDKLLANVTAEELQTWFRTRSIELVIHPVGTAEPGTAAMADADADWHGVDLVVVLGGDGTLIRAAQVVAPLGIPILGVNTGHLGFLTEIESSEVFDHLDAVLSGQFVIEERLMLSAEAFRDGQSLLKVTALNDAVVSKGPRARLVHLEIAVGETTVARYRADGVVVASPTGSTAYSLSAGGPIVSPTVNVLLVTPICPHTMNSRAMVVSGSESVFIAVVESPSEVGLSVDGTDPFPLYAGDVVRVSRAPHVARLVRRHEYRFYDVLRQKLSDPTR